MQEATRAIDIEGTAPIRPLLPGLTSVYAIATPLVFPVIRFWAGASLVPHGAQKLFGSFGADPARIATLFEKIGFVPGGFFVTLTGAVEFFAGLLVAFGLFTRPAALACFVLLATTVGVQSGFGWFWTSGGVEYALMWTMLMATIVVRGGDRLSLDRLIGREF